MAGRFSLESPAAGSILVSPLSPSTELVIDRNCWTKPPRKIPGWLGWVAVFPVVLVDERCGQFILPNWVVGRLAVRVPSS
jgi:hypothetical protein